MGIVKRMMEHYDHECEETPVSFVCPECGDLSDGHAGLPKIVDHHEYELSFEIQVQCIWCNEDFSAQFVKDAGGCKVTFDDHPKVEVEFDPVYFDGHMREDWDYDPSFYDRPDEPFPVFKEAYEELVSNIQSHSVKDGQSSMNRMFFSQSFSIFESYLCDVFQELVFLDNDNQKKFMGEYNEVKKLSLSLSDLMKNGEFSAKDIVRKKLIEKIKAILFHNLSRAVSLFKIYNVSIFPNDDGKELLVKAVEYRHHAVHRNGSDLEGNKLNVYTKDYITQIAEAMMEVANHINDEISKIEDEKSPF